MLSIKEFRYSIAMIARNNLVAAAQNITGAQRYLSNVEFPYCAPSEVETEIFSDDHNEILSRLRL